MSYNHTLEMYRQKEVAERWLHRVNHFINSKTSKTPSRGDKTIFFLKQGNKTQNLGWWIWGCKERSYSYSSTSERSFHFYSDFCALRLTICCTDNIIISFILYLPVNTEQQFTVIHITYFKKTYAEKKNPPEMSPVLLVSTWNPLAQVTTDFLPEE